MASRYASHVQPSPMVQVKWFLPFPAVLSQVISLVLVVITLMRRTDACRLELKKFRFYKPQLVKMIRIGLPAGVQGSMFSISNVMIQSSINSG